MTREQIEKAAKETLVNEPVEIQATKVDAFQRGFIAGAQWRVNSVWHGGNEKYEIRLPSVVVFKNGKAAIYSDLRDVTYDGLWDEVKEYAYWKDLLPDRKEDER